MSFTTYILFYVYEDDLNRKEQEIEAFTNCQGSNRENILRTYIE